MTRREPTPVRWAGAAAIACCLAVMLASTCWAGGVNFAWNGCLPEGGVSSLSSQCSGNTGSIEAVGSFVVSQPRPAFVGNEIAIDIQADASALPDWWQYFNDRACRATALSASFDFRGAPQTSCTDPFSGLAMGGLAAYQTAQTYPAVPSGAPNAARLVLGVAVATPSPLSAGVEYYCFRLRITMQRTTGGGACAGCTVPVCLTLNEIRAAENTGPVERLTNALQSSMISWQEASGCQSAVKNRTWGQVKNLYR